MGRVGPGPCKPRQPPTRNLEGCCHCWWGRRRGTLTSPCRLLGIRCDPQATRCQSTWRTRWSREGGGGEDGGGADPAEQSPGRTGPHKGTSQSGSSSSSLVPLLPLPLPHPPAPGPDNGSGPRKPLPDIHWAAAVPSPGASPPRTSRGGLAPGLPQPCPGRAARPGPPWASQSEFAHFPFWAPIANSPPERAGQRQENGAGWLLPPRPNATLAPGLVIKGPVVWRRLPKGPGTLGSQGPFCPAWDAHFPGWQESSA